MTARTRITMPIRGSVHEGGVPDDAGWAVVCVSVGCPVVAPVVWETVGAT